MALTAARTVDEHRQGALTRYNLAAGAGGVAVGVHTTPFAIRDPVVDGLLGPWPVWTHGEVELLYACHALTYTGSPEAALPMHTLRLSTDRRYPHLNDDTFVAENRDVWFR